MTDQNNNWCGEQDEILIDFVRNHEPLFNVKSAEYRKMELKQKLWHEVGTILSKTDTNCSKRWAYIRDHYIRKRGKPGTGSASEAAKKRSELLSFLDSCLSGKRSTISNIPHDEEAIDSQNIPQISAIEPTTPRDEDADGLSRDVYSPESS
ncbi:Alcohol dehydrogenase transcription factor Myb/SANT-like [Popillia japonica]|uniref:Alcohol dehydrogenase transcription factor Myb/SANT-like n=1 Tax=Popillia japonica TaxID=7064 RepID=A0AAW1LUP2_POPJA